MSSIPPKLRFAVLVRDKFTCQYCGRSAAEGALHVDHVVPVAMGGATAPDNLKAACVPCNLGKGSIPIDDVEWAIEIGYFQFLADFKAVDSDGVSDATVRAMWVSEVAPYLRRAMREGMEDPAFFCMGIGHAEVVTRVVDFLEGRSPSALESMRASYAAANERSQRLSRPGDEVYRFVSVGGPDRRFRAEGTD